jgi:hypothetical protein
MILRKMKLHELVMRIWTDINGPEHERATGFTNREMKVNLGIMSYLERYLSRTMLYGFT